MSKEISQALIEAGVLIVSAFAGMIIAYLHSYTRRFQEKVKENESLKQELKTKEAKIETLRVELSGIPGPKEHLKIKEISEQLDTRITKLERAIQQKQNQGLI